MTGVYRMKRIIARAALVAAAASGLAGCGSSGGNAVAPPPPAVVVPAPQEDQFGAVFGTAFRASFTATPITPADGNIIPLSLTTNPVNVG